MKTLLKVSSVAVAGMLLMGTTAFAKGEKYTLESMKVSSPISLEASNPIWNKAKALSFEMSETPYKPKNFKGMTSTNVTLKSAHDDKNFYLYMQYEDPTNSYARFPWVKQEDGSWKKMSNKDQTGHENTWYEDKVGVYFNINTRGFAKKGCAISCHITKDGKNNGFSDNSAGRKYTRKAGETIDMWHWKGVRTGLPFNLSHDQYVDNQADPALSSTWGRKGDEKAGGGYKYNGEKGAKVPAFMNPNGEFGVGSIIETTKVPFVDTFKAGDKVPNVIVTEMSGSAADIQTSNHYADGVRTLVFKRALTTNHPKSNIQDVQFSDLSKPYYMGVSVFDNTQINHVFHDGSIKLLFK
ncbi:ethylbenzene dehydrogenase-related protein [Sulfurospirillum sp.]|nr:ethylbenzene dehydrogenase-related protein [Sulfurospirillum sp.]